MAEIQTEIPPWLQRNWQPREPFDPSPWLQERYNRQITAQKLPLELQQMALQNQAHQLAIEHQGMQNDLQNQELQQYKTELPAINDYLMKASSIPGGTMALPLPPGIKSKMGMDTLLNRQKFDADTAQATALKQRIISDTQRNANVIAMGGNPVPQNPDGTFDQTLLAQEEHRALDLKQQRDIKTIQKKAQAEAQAKQMYEKDPAIMAGLDLAKLKETLLQSKAATANVAESTPELEGELARQRQLQTVIDTMESKQNKQPGTLQEKMATSNRLDAAVKAAADAGDASALNDAIQERDRTEALIYPKGTKIEGVNPVTGKPEIRIAGGTTSAEDEMTAKTRSGLQQQVQGSIAAAKTLHDMQQKVDWSTVGPLAYTAEKLGRFGPGGILGVAGDSGAAGRAEIRGAKMDIMQQMERAGHSSTAVMKVIESTLPSMGFFETPTAAQAAVAERKRSVILEGLNASHQLGQKPPPELIQLLSTYKASELTRMVNTGLVDSNDAQSAYDLQRRSPTKNPSNTPVADWLKR